jgi:hypothetical protein
VTWLEKQSLEGKYLILELADGSGLGVAQEFGGLLHRADHGRGTAEQDPNIASWGGQPFLKRRTALNRNESKEQG